MFLVGHLLFDMIKNLNISAIGGLEFGATPIAVATALISKFNQKSIDAFSIRKTPKDHGIVKWIEGPVKLGDRVVIIDDVVTTGGSTIKAIKRSQDLALSIVKVIILVDRQEGGLENIQKHIPNASSIITKDELI